MNIAMLLEMAAGAMGDRAAIGPQDALLTYAELLDQSRRAATVVREVAAERISLVDENSTAVPQLLYASAIAGVPFAPINYRLADDRLRAVLARVAPGLVVVEAGAVERVKGIPGLTVLQRDDLAARSADAEPADTEPGDPDSVAIWLFTSGTTGEPKVVLLRHRHVVSYVLSTVEFMSSGEEEATLVSVPPYHIAGIVTILTATYAGRRIVYLPHFDAGTWVGLAATERITHAMVVPTMLSRILDAMEAQDEQLPALRHVSYGGGRMPMPVIERALDLLPQVGFVNAYGLTETSSTIAVLGPDEHRAAHRHPDPAVRARLGSVGRPLPTLELEIRDEKGQALPPGHTGEIYVRGEQVAGEYLGRSALTADGWFPTNDGGYLDDGGFLHVEGRIDDVIVRGAENMSPGEIEDVLLLHPAVDEAAVTGVPDDEWGETVAAAVVLKEGAAADEAELQQWVRERLRSSRTPVIVEVRDTLPYTPTGKLMRNALRRELADLLKARQT
jgi:acyl-CoA synthetase (AMP-forming)/AMP-acid ligase II